MEYERIGPFWQEIENMMIIIVESIPAEEEITPVQYCIVAQDYVLVKYHTVCTLSRVRTLYYPVSCYVNVALVSREQVIVYETYVSYEFSIGQGKRTWNSERNIISVFITDLRILSKIKVCIQRFSRQIFQRIYKMYFYIFCRMLHIGTKNMKNKLCADR